VQVINADVAKKQKACQEDLAKAEPALIAAKNALGTLNKVSDRVVDWFSSFVDQSAKVLNHVSCMFAYHCLLASLQDRKKKTKRKRRISYTAIPASVKYKNVLL